MAFGEPRGEKIRFSGEDATEILVIGMGAIHFRVDDDRGPCRVGFARTSATGIGYKWTF